jgi:AcrR family transcriptional regulator
LSSAGGKREQILDGASRVFAEYGFRKTTIADIVREAGVARATVYNHFDTKEDVFDAVFQREVQEMLGAVAEAVAEAETTREKLRAALIAHTDLLRKKLNVMRVMVEAAAHGRAHCGAGADELQARAIGIYEEILRGGSARGEVSVDDASASARILILFFKGLFMATVAEAIGSERDAMVDGMLDTIMNGLRPREDRA